MDARRSAAAWIASVLVALGGCGSNNSDATTVPANATASTSLSGASGGANGGGAAGGGGGGGGGASASPTVPTLPASSESDTSLLTTPDFGAYTVKQIVTLGGESIHGLVCDVRHPFVVDAATSKVAWTFIFSPTTNKGTSGNVSYAYSIPSAGESHDAKGTYKVSDSDPSGVRHVDLTVSDHVVFKGFDGNIPNRYKFDLVPAATCPAG